MTDIVERLRRGATNGVLIPCEDLVKAADIIEQYRADSTRDELTIANLVRDLAASQGSAGGELPCFSELEDANTACVELAAKHGYATGHGDTVADMIREFSAQIPIAAQARQEPSLAQIDSAAQYLVATVERVLWGGLRTDGRASDDGFEPFHSAQFTYAVNGNARQEDYRDVIREIEKRLGAPSVPSAQQNTPEK